MNKIITKIITKKNYNKNLLKNSSLIIQASEGVSEVRRTCFANIIKLSLLG